MAENFNLIFGSQAPTTASWSDADYQTGWNVVGSTPPTAEQFDALQNRSDKKAQELNNRMLPLEQKAEEQGRQAGTAYTVGAAVTVDGLPADWLLICTTAGTSGTVAITLPDPLLDGATINDGTITWTLRKIATNGSLGYRQPSTAYTAGQIAYHASLPTGWYLECITAGTTSSGDLTISSPAIDGTVSDGAVVWTISRAVGYFGGTINNPIISTGPNGMVKPNNTGVLSFDGGDPWVGDSAVLALHGGSEYSLPGAFVLAARNANNQVNLVGVPNGDLAWNGNDLAGAAIVAKSLDTNGYIKYASGLIMQWGYATINGNGTITFPISFSSVRYTIFSQGKNAANDFTQYVFTEGTTGTIPIYASNTGERYMLWFAIGY